MTQQKHPPAFIERQCHATLPNCYFTGELSLPGLLKNIQNAADEHSKALGVSYPAMQEQSLFFVLFQQRIRMREWPVFDELFSIKTWLRPMNDRFAIRESAIIRNNKKIGESSAAFMLLDAKTRRPQRLSAFWTEESRHQIDIERDNHHADIQPLDFTAQKIKVPELPKISSLAAKISDLDINHHVSNTQYAQWMMDLLPQAFYQRQVIQEYSINFLAETLLQDIVGCHGTIAELSLEKDNHCQFYGTRQSDDKKLFTAELVSIPRDGNR